jgi:hypothetical protein
LKNRQAKVGVVSESVVPGIAVEGADETWAYEQHTSGHRSAGTTLLLAWTTGAYLAVAAASGQPAWNWDDLTTLAARQRQRLPVQPEDTLPWRLGEHPLGPSDPDGGSRGRCVEAVSAPERNGQSRGSDRD